MPFKVSTAPIFPVMLRFFVQPQKVIYIAFYDAVFFDLLLALCILGGEGFFLLSQLLIFFTQSRYIRQPSIDFGIAQGFYSCFMQNEFTFMSRAESIFFFAF